MYLFNYIAQSSDCIIEIFNRFFLKNDIETKDVCKFDKIVSSNTNSSKKVKDKIVNQIRSWMEWKSSLCG